MQVFRQYIFCLFFERISPTKAYDKLCIWRRQSFVNYLKMALWRCTLSIRNIRLVKLEQLWYYFSCVFPSYSWGEMGLISVILAVSWPCKRKKSGCGKCWECEIQWKWLMIRMDSLSKRRQNFQWESNLWATPSLLFVLFFWAAESVNRMATCCSKMQGIQKFAEG